MGAKFPSWMMLRPLLLNHLKKIHLLECNKCDRLPTLGDLPNLRDLEIHGMDNLKCIGAEFYDCSCDYDATTASKETLSFFPKLRTLNIENCSELIEWMEAPTESTDRVAVFPSLEEMHISNCPKLGQAPSHFPSLKKLHIYSVDSATPLESISRRLSTLTSLKIEFMEELSCLPEGMLKKNKNLTSLEIQSCGELTCIAPDVFGCCPSLGSMVVDYCEKLRYLPDGLHTLPVLETLYIQQCPSLELIPITDGMASLRQLKIGYCEGLSCLPSGLMECTFLQVLTIRGCNNLKSIPSTHSLVSLRQLEISSCERLSGPLGGLEYCASLQELHIYSCPNLTSIPTTDCQGISLTSLQLLGIGNCDSLQSIPPLHSFPSLRELNIDNCKKLQSLVQIPVSVERLSMSGLPNLETHPSLRSLTRLKSLTIGKYWEELDSFPDFQVPSSSQLESLELYGWPKLNSLPQQIQHFTSLKFLQIQYFDGVEALPEWLGNLTSLNMLLIRDCKNLKYLPSVKAMQSLTKLQTLWINDCPLLQNRCTRGSGPEWAKISHIPNILGLAH